MVGPEQTPTRRGPRWGQVAIALVLVILSGALGAFVGFRSIAADSDSAISNGQWEIDPTLASSASSSSARAYLAKFGLLGLPSSEAIYFIADEADSGAMQSDRTYEIVGNDLPGEWWSLTLYGADQFLIPNERGRYSVRSSDIAREPDGSFRVVVSREPQPGNWIPSGEAKDMSLLLRVYNPDPSLMNRLGSVALPVIREVETAR